MPQNLAAALRKRLKKDLAFALRTIGSLYDSVLDSLWKNLVSVRFTIALLVLITAFSIVGTLVAQQGTTQVPIEKLYKPEVLKWLMWLGLTDIYHSLTFVFLLMLLALNLIACSIERLPRIWKQIFRVPAPPLEDPMLSDWTSESARKRKYRVERFAEPAKSLTIREAKMATFLLLQKYFKQYAVVRDEEHQFQVMVEKGKYSRLGVYITHLSLLLIMVGAGLGSIFGLEGGMTIEEGTRQSWIQHLRGSNGGMALVHEKGIPVQGFLNLGFEVECEKFTLETYDGQRPKAFRSKLNFYENDVKTVSAEIAVNHPFVYKGLTFYQASYSEVGIGGVDLKVYRNLPKSGIQKASTTVELVEDVRIGDLYRVDGNAGFKILQVESNLMDLGPAAKIQYYRNREAKKPEEFWIFQSLPGFDFAHRKGASLNFVLDMVKPKYATGISVARDPGVWVVWVGSTILILALFLALYTCHSRYWIAYREKQGFVVVGWSNKLFLFEPRFEKFLSAFRQELKT